MYGPGARSMNGRNHKYAGLRASSRQTPAPVGCRCDGGAPAALGRRHHYSSRLFIDHVVHRYILETVNALFTRGETADYSVRYRYS
ncbi:hypothetical protein J6590_080130 [Homalodisca vitripennis]|nr:hypothetical protein J6590_080130 [Homalodisca vitripennis]